MHTVCKQFFITLPINRYYSPTQLILKLQFISCLAFMPQLSLPSSLFSSFQDFTLSRSHYCLKIQHFRSHPKQRLKPLLFHVKAPLLCKKQSFKMIRVLQQEHKLDELQKLIMKHKDQQYLCYGYRLNLFRKARQQSKFEALLLNDLILNFIGVNSKEFLLTIDINFVLALCPMNFFSIFIPKKNPLHRQIFYLNLSSMQREVNPLKDQNQSPILQLFHLMIFCFDPF